jgi:DNA modification methylase
VAIEMNLPLEILIGCCIKRLDEVAPKSVRSIVTSPPYWGQRDYRSLGQIGLEENPALYVTRLVQVFRKARRVLRDDGTVWLNLGDTYAGGGAGGGGSFSRDRIHLANKNEQAHWKAKNGRVPNGFKCKDLIGVPWRVAFALQEDGWFLRQDIIWHKPNPMPESVGDRCTKSHEYIFLLAKSHKYFFDPEGIRERGVYPAGTRAAKGSAKRAADGRVNSRPAEYKVYDGFRNKRSVWTVSTKPSKQEHYATFPAELIEPCILAGSQRGDLILDPFAGTGTTAEVAMRLGRRALMIEINPRFARRIRGRCKNITTPING